MRGSWATKKHGARVRELWLPSLWCSSISVVGEGPRNLGTYLQYFGKGQHRKPSSCAAVCQKKRAGMHRIYKIWHIPVFSASAGAQTAAVRKHRHPWCLCCWHDCFLLEETPHAKSIKGGNFLILCVVHGKRKVLVLALPPIYAML